MPKFEVSYTQGSGGITFFLGKSGLLGIKRASLPYENWPKGIHPASGLLELLVENDAARVSHGGVFIAHETIACMSVAETTSLALPKRCPYALRLEAVGALSDDRFEIRTVWIDGSGDEVHGLRRDGTLLLNVVERVLVCEPMFSLLEEVDQLNQLSSKDSMTPGTLDARMVRFGRFKQVLAQVTGESWTDDYIDRVTIHQATALSLIRSAGDLFEPMLFGDVPDPTASPEHEDTVVRRRSLLGDELATKFRTVLFPRQGARSHYRLREGVYTVMDPPVEAALHVVEKVNQSNASIKAAFAADPRSFLTEAIEKAGGTGEIFLELGTQSLSLGYGERVLGIREWEGVKLSFKIPVHREWFPCEAGETEAFTIQVPGSPQPLLVTPGGVSRLRDVIEEAKISGRPDFEFDGRSFPLSHELDDTVAKLHGFVSPERDGRRKKAKPEAASKLLVLRVAENEEDLVFNARMRDPGGSLAYAEADARLKTDPKRHQVDGIAWLRHAFLSGMPGVLLADDMGLGKTFQVLAFLHWLRANEAGVKRPILVVAPKKLLEVWLDEISQHIGAEGLGRPELAFDEHLRNLKIESGKEGELGRHVLDVERLAAADWVLTTYETLRDYHMSFGNVIFRVVIYDEAQKMKSTASLVNNAAKGQQPEFTILMTGTPIENSVMDLWTLLDVAWPGYLGLSGREFARTYGEEGTPERYAELKQRLVDPARVGDRECPPIMIRRFKADVVEGLPCKTERKWRRDMPPEQVRAYDALITAQRVRKLPALQALQALRSAAFHPNLQMPEGPADHARIIDASARFQSLFDILDSAQSAGERVLVFVDLHQGQRVLAELIRQRYRLPRYPQVINGDTATRALNQIKADFQGGRGFDVLLLGPRSAGFGLTLTAANHVVHMNRWWNPAVEDQCSDRVYRLGQDKDVTIHVPIAVHPVLGDASFDVVLDQLLSEKRALSREIVVPTTMTERDFRRMMGTLVGEVSAGETTLEALDTMGWRAFEEWTAQQFVSAGYRADLTLRTADAGADVILRPPGGSSARPIVCQCKHRSLGVGSVDDEAVGEVMDAAAAYIGGRALLKNPLLVVVTNGQGTLKAKRLAFEKQVQWVDRSRVGCLSAMAREFLSA